MVRQILRSRLIHAFSAFFLFGILGAWALDVSVGVLPNSSSTAGRIQFLTGTVEYVNKDNDSTIIGNYLSGSYYDNMYGFFQFNWSTDPNANVRIVDSSDKCPTGYGYKLGGFAKSTTLGFINFAPDANNYVYYCESDGKLHGYAYSDHVGAQVFEWLPFLPSTPSTLLSDTTNNPTATDPNDPFFSNNTVSIRNDPDPFSLQLQWEVTSSENGKEAVFYIIK